MNVNINPVSGIPGQSYDFIDKWMTNPMILFFILFVIMMFYALSAYAGSNENMGMNTSMFSSGTGAGSGSGGGRVIEMLMWGVFLTVVMMNALKYFYGADITANVRNLMGDKPELDVTITPDAKGNPLSAGAGSGGGQQSYSKEVFHVPGNKYTYNDAKAVCAAYGGKLATYNEMEDAYEDGADWCSYGWSEDQMAFFPTQKEKWEKLQKKEGYKHACGRPGINGGYIANPNVRFGVNCYGYKPDITANESKMMRETPALPVSKKDQDFQKLVADWKTKIPNILLAPFNNKSWSSF